MPRSKKYEKFVIEHAMSVADELDCKVAIDYGTGGDNKGTYFVGPVRHQPPRTIRLYVVDSEDILQKP